MRTGAVTDALCELNEKGYIADETLSRMSAEEVVFAVAQSSGEDFYDYHA
ncbi:hypothetical protein [Stenotrophomonas oahuensis]|uniref:Uncharacterized protein n=1 Tax=Stenotrophomonas oahuensis TaxID=3003271 RepID=A0ABY9YP15_9GAMM|nr:hypothetical protein [Stenotrophomonas sp. A5586]WNH52458.1 hypothetical protein PDM29_19400 [Stenotrophomonas sp. A5586]